MSLREKAQLVWTFVVLVGALVSASLSLTSGGELRSRIRQESSQEIPGFQLPKDQLIP